MRKIEQQMLEAIKAKKTWSLNNTAVIYDKVCNESYVFLHGNQLGWFNYDKDAFEMWRPTYERWPTRTTKSRLRALGVRI